uniref:Protein kinase domain-containing protein n=1 Tax=Megaselia scalaris TaxID=36166 RepID=T1GUH5_MEGSC
MWSVGVICYVLLSGISPFMGETDIETMANVTVAKYDFDDEAFSQVSKEALDFISKLLVKDLSSRMTATQCLEHTWLKRKPKPKTSAKPKKVPPPKLKKISKSPPATPTTETKVNGNGTTEEQKKDVELSKDNLKTFIERWEEHPNSPYVFDVESNVIMPLKDSSRNSISSSR